MPIISANMFAIIQGVCLSRQDFIVISRIFSAGELLSEVKGEIAMGLFDGLLGNASEVNINEVREKYGAFLAPDESINQAYKVIRDMYIFTDWRIILVDVQGMTGKKVEYHSIPYKSITHFAVESAGNFDMDAELKIWISGMGPTPIEKNFGKTDSIYKIQALLVEYVRAQR